MNRDLPLSERFVSRSISTYLLMLSVWVLANLAPFTQKYAFVPSLLSQYFFDEKISKSPSAGKEALLTILGIFLIVLICEGCLAVTLAGLAKGSLGLARSAPARFLARAFTILLLSALTLYLLLVTASWYLFLTAGAFLRLSDMALGAFGEQAAFRLISIADVLPILGALLLSAAIAAGVYLSAPPIQSWGRALRHLLMLCLLSAPLVMLSSKVNSRIAGKGLEYFLTLTRHAIAPQYSLLWADLLFDEAPKPDLAARELQLIPRSAEAGYIEKASALPKRKNAILVMIEAMRSDVLAAAGGSPLIVPNTNRLAAEGHSFTQARAHDSDTSYSLASILTGLYPLKFEHRDLHTDLGYPFLLIYDLLAAVGYKTAYITEEWAVDTRYTRTPKIDLVLDDKLVTRDDIIKRIPDAVFDRESEGYTSWPSLIDRYKTEILKDWIRDNRQDRFFAFFYMTSSHFSYYQGPEEFRPFSPYKLQSAPGYLHYPESISETVRNRYWNALHYIDSLVGQIVELLKSEGLAEDTILIVTGDHGEMFHEHGLVTHSSYLYDEVLKVPLVISNAREFSPAHGYGSPVGHVDIAPTILHLLGLPPHANFQGDTILVRPGEAPPPEKPHYSSVQIFVNEDCMLEWPWKYCENYSGRPARLFDLAADPGESRDLAQSPEHSSKRDDLAKKLSDYRYNQLAYYSPHLEHRRGFFPPKAIRASGILGGPQAVEAPRVPEEAPGQQPPLPREGS